MAEENNSTTTTNNDIAEVSSLSNVEEFLDFYSDLIKSDSVNHDLYNRRSLCYLFLKRYEDALHDAEQIIALQPDLAIGYIRKGNVLLSKGDIHDAKQTFKQGLRRCSNDEDLRQGLSRAEAEMSNLESDSTHRAFGRMAEQLSDNKDEIEYLRETIETKIVQSMGSDVEFIKKQVASMQAVQNEILDLKQNVNSLQDNVKDIKRNFDSLQNSMAQVFDVLQDLQLQQTHSRHHYPRNPEFIDQFDDHEFGEYHEFDEYHDPWHQQRRHREKQQQKRKIKLQQTEQWRRRRSERFDIGSSGRDALIVGRQQPINPSRVHRTTQNWEAIADIKDELYDATLPPIFSSDMSDLDERLFCAQFEARFGENHPFIFEVPLAEVLQDALEKDNRPILIYLHDDRSSSSDRLCRHLLCNSNFINFLMENFFCWGWDMTFESARSVFFQQHCRPEIANASLEALPAIIVVDQNEDRSLRVLDIVEDFSNEARVKSKLLQASIESHK